MKKVVIRVAGALVVTLLAILGGLVLRASSAGGPAPVPQLDPIDVRTDRVAAQLGAYLRVDTQLPAGPGSWATVSGPDGETRPAWVDLLVRAHVEPLGLPWRMLDGALVIEIPSDDPRPPVLWLSHADVVAVDPADLDHWTHPPFDGTVADGFVWGRGAADNKASTICQLEAVAALQATGIAPSRRVVMVVTPDEETSGATAQALAANRLADLGGPVAVIDEGSFVIPDTLPGTLMGAVAVAEKAFVSFDLVVRAHGGHSSMPTGDSAIDVLAAALVRVGSWQTDASLFPSMVDGFRRMAHTRPFPESVVLGNADLLGPLLLGVVQRTAAGNAVTRDTIAATIVSAGVKDNVIPGEARATLNARLLPGTDPEAFQARLEAVIDDPRVVVGARGWPARAGVASTKTETFHAIEAALPWAVPGTVPIASLTPATMDARFFGAAGLDAYRIHPFILDAEARGGIHGLDEKLAVEDLARGVRFYAALLQLL